MANKSTKKKRASPVYTIQALLSLDKAGVFQWNTDVKQMMETTDSFIGKTLRKMGQDILGETEKIAFTASSTINTILPDEGKIGTFKNKINMNLGNISDEWLNLSRKGRDGVRGLQEELKTLEKMGFDATQLMIRMDRLMPDRYKEITANINAELHQQVLDLGKTTAGLKQLRDTVIHLAPREFTAAMSTYGALFHPIQRAEMLYRNLTHHTDLGGFDKLMAIGGALKSDFKSVAASGTVLGNVFKAITSPFAELLEIGALLTLMLKPFFKILEVLLMPLISMFQQLFVQMLMQFYPVFAQMMQEVAQLVTALLPGLVFLSRQFAGILEIALPIVTGILTVFMYIFRFAADIVGWLLKVPIIALAIGAALGVVMTAVVLLVTAWLIFTTVERVVGFVKVLWGVAEAIWGIVAAQKAAAATQVELGVSGAAEGAVAGGAAAKAATTKAATTTATDAAVDGAVAGSVVGGVEKGGIIVSLLSPFRRLGGWIIDNLPRLGAWAARMVRWTLDAGKSAVEFGAEMWEAVGGLAGIGDFIAEAGTAIGAAVTSAVGLLVAAVVGAVASVAAAGYEIYEHWKTVKWLGSEILGFFIHPLKSMENAWGGIKGAFRESWFGSKELGPAKSLTTSNEAYLKAHGDSNEMIAYMKAHNGHTEAQMAYFKAHGHYETYAPPIVHTAITSHLATTHAQTTHTSPTILVHPPAIHIHSSLLNAGHDAKEALTHHVAEPIVDAIGKSARHIREGLHNLKDQKPNIVMPTIFSLHGYAV